MSEFTYIRSTKQVILYDGVCKLCNAWVVFLLRKGVSKDIRFSAIQNDISKAILKSVGLPEENIRTIVLVKQDMYWLRAGAIFRVMAHLPWPWKILSVMRFLPRFVTDSVYKIVAFNRYRLFGRFDDIQIIKADFPERFL